MTALVVMTTLISSCAYIVSREFYPLHITCNPTNTNISITNKKGKEIFLGKTPTTVRLSAGDRYFSKAEYTVKFSNPGFDDKIVPVHFKLDGWYFGNLLFGGIIGLLIVDPATGAMWKIESEFLDETLTKSLSVNEPRLNIFDINDIPEDWKRHLVKLD
jgi:hypothetical protein